MELNQIFQQPVERPIEGVIKADDESHLYDELNEYVLTDEIAKRLERFLDAYNNYTGANGVWISGFYGSGKSHLLKMLAYLLENGEINGTRPLDLFLAKTGDDKLLSAALEKAVSVPTKSVLFNIDQKADIISKTQDDAILSVFMKVFDDMCGYFGKQGYIAQFERDLDNRDQLATFKEAYQRIAGKAWDKGRESVLLESGNVAKALAEIKDEQPEDNKGILEGYRKQYSLSIEDFGELVKGWLDQQPANTRLVFLVDEVGQYIADNTKLMTNLQTVAETLATFCEGRAWIVVTAQEDMDNVLGGMQEKEERDFSKIQARFANRLKLTSANVAEVIQKRLLTKNQTGEQVLGETYDQYRDSFSTLFQFADGSREYAGFRDQTHFIYSYPFIPYQFELFQTAIRGLSDHNQFEGRASSVGERSMLGVFREVAMAINSEEVGQLATFDRMFEGIRGALKTGIQSAINVAENNLDDPYAVRVLKTLFLVKYVREFKASARNLGVLMLQRFDADLPALHARIEQALNRLEQQTYIQRNGEAYEYLTDTEKDVEEEIKRTEVENATLQDELNKLLFDGVIRQRKIRYNDNQDFPYTRRMDDRALSREHELAIHIITSLSENFDNLQIQHMQSMGRDELRVVLPADSRFMQDLAMLKKTETYRRQNSNTQQQDIKNILDSKIVQNNERYNELQNRANALLGQATLIVNGAELDNGSQDGQTSVLKGFYQLIEKTYTNLRMLPDIAYKEDAIRRYLRAEDGLLTSDAANLTEPEQELFDFIRNNNKSGVRVTVKSLLERFQKKTYGWYYAAILCHLAMLCARGKIEVQADGNTLETDALERGLRNTASHGNLILEPQADYSPAQIRELKEFFNEFIGQPPTNTEARALARETREAIKDQLGQLKERKARQDQYPFLSALDPIISSLEEVAKQNPAWFLTDLPKTAEDLLEAHENTIAPIQTFMKGNQRAIYDQARQLLNEQRDNLAYIQNDDLADIQSLLDSTRPWQGNQLTQVKPKLDNLQQAITQKLAEEKSHAEQRLDTLENGLQSMAGYSQLDADAQAQIAEAFQQQRNTLQSQQQIAMVRDLLRRFEDRQYQQLLAKLVTPAPSSSYTDGGASTATPSQSTTKAPNNAPEKVSEPSMVRGGTIHVGYHQPLVSNETELDEYLQKLRNAWLAEIQNGNHIQI